MTIMSLIVTVQLYRALPKTSPIEIYYEMYRRGWITEEELINFIRQYYEEVSRGVGR